MSKEKSLREELSEAFDDHEESDTVDAPEVAEATEVEAESTEPEATVEASAEDDTPAESKSVENPPIEPPYTWPKEDKEFFKTLPRNVQSIITRREGEREAYLGKISQEAARAKRMAEEYQQIIEPYAEGFKLAGRTPAQEIQQLFAIREFLERDPANAIKWLAEQRGVDVSKVGGTTPQGNAELLSLKRELDGLKAELQNRALAVEQQQLKATTADIEAWASELDDNDKPIRPYVAKVFSEVVPMLGELRAQYPHQPNSAILDMAYERAIWANPETRQELLKAQSATVQADKTAISKAKTAQAKKAGVSVTGAPISAASNGSDAKSIRSAIIEAWDKHS